MCPRMEHTIKDCSASRRGGVPATPPRAPHKAAKDASEWLQRLPPAAAILLVIMRIWTERRRGTRTAARPPVRGERLSLERLTEEFSRNHSSAMDSCKNEKHMAGSKLRADKCSLMVGPIPPMMQTIWSTTESRQKVDRKDTGTQQFPRSSQI